MKASKSAARRRGSRKATYSLPEELLDKLERASSSSRGKSGIVAEALVRYFVEGERRALEAEFEAAARDPLFREDNAAVSRDFAALDREASERKR